jgi:hypothetical protein
MSGAERNPLNVVTGSRGEVWHGRDWGAWKMNRYRGKATKGLCPTCSELENAKHVILCCGETADWRMKLKCKKWLNYREKFIIKHY